MLMLLIRPWVCRRILPRRSKMSIYAAMYFIPILTLLHAVIGGLLCKFILPNSQYFILHTCFLFRLFVSVFNSHNICNIMCCAFRCANGPESIVTHRGYGSGLEKCSDTPRTLVSACVWNYFYYSARKSYVAFVAYPFGAIARSVLHFHSQVYGSQ